MAKFESMQSVFRSNLKPRARLVLQCLVLHGNQAGECFPSIKTIANQCGYGVSTVKRALDELLEAGYIKKTARFDERKNGGQTSNLYTLCSPLPEQPAPAPEKAAACAVPSVEEAPARKAAPEKDSAAPQGEPVADETPLTPIHATPRESRARALFYTFAEGIIKSAERNCPVPSCEGSPQSHKALWEKGGTTEQSGCLPAGRRSGAQFAPAWAGGQPIFVPP